MTTEPNPQAQAYERRTTDADVSALIERMPAGYRDYLELVRHYILACERALAAAVERADDAERRVRNYRSDVDSLRAILGGARMEDGTPIETNHDAARRVMKERDALRAEVEALKAKDAEWQDEVTRFNRGWERRAEPYSKLEDEFEQMGWAWAHVDELKARQPHSEAVRRLCEVGHDFLCNDDYRDEFRAALTAVERAFPEPPKMGEDGGGK